MKTYFWSRERAGMLPSFLLTLFSLIIGLGNGGAGSAQSWSPDSHQILIGGNPLLVASSPIGTPLAKPASLFGSVSGSLPSWSPDGKRVTYLAPNNQLTLMETVGNKRLEIPGGSLSPVAWSPENDHFAVIQTPTGKELNLRIFSPAGQREANISLPFKTLGLQYGVPLAWIPQTDDVIIAGGNGAQNDLFLIEQGQVVPLTTTGDVLGFVVSTDGKRVVWARRSPNTRYILFSLYELTIQTRTMQKLPFPMVVPAVNPNPKRSPEAVLNVVFSLDLQHLSFVTRGGPNLTSNDVSLYLSDISGKQVRLLGQGKISASPAPSNATGWTFPAIHPVFSPDSKQLATVRLEGEKRLLALFAIPAGDARSILLSSSDTH